MAATSPRARAAFVTALLLTGVLVPTAASAAATCLGEAATHEGTSGDDVIVGTDGRDVIVTFGGDDVIRSGAGDDLICAGTGNDRVIAGTGDDVVRAGPGRDEVDGNAGRDEIRGQGGDDVLRGGSGRDLIFGGPGDDVIDGGSYPDVLRGRTGDDRIEGGLGRDRILGNSGRDTLRGGDHDDSLWGGSGADDLEGEAGDDRLFGGPDGDSLKGGGGRDTIDGGAGDDVIWELHRWDTHSAEGDPEAAGDVFAYDSLTVIPRGGWVRWQPAPGAAIQGHEGVLTITNRPDGLLMVERVGAERYLLGLAEMPFSWPAAALESQAIAARTYLASVLDGPWGPMVTYGFDICDWSLCQVYKGTERGAGLVWEDAVVATAGQVLLYGGDPAGTFYHSTSGDTTRSVQDVWTSASALPYLQAVPVPDQGSPYEDWFYKLPLEVFLDVLADEGISFGGEIEVIRTVVTEPGDGPYRVIVRTSTERRVLEVGPIQRALNAHFSELASGGYLPPSHLILGQSILSPTFTVRLRSDGDVAVRGQGWGHQIGLGQFGARAMADGGSTSAEILGHFYTGLAPEADPGFIPDLIDVGLAYGSTERVIVLRPEDRAVVRSGPVVAVPEGGSITITRFGDDAVALSFGP